MERYVKTCESSSIYYSGLRLRVWETKSRPGIGPVHEVASRCDDLLQRSNRYFGRLNQRHHFPADLKT